MSGLGRVQRIAARQRAYTGPNPCNRCPEPQAPGSIFCASHKLDFNALAERVKSGTEESIDEIAKFCERIYWGPVKGSEALPTKQTAADRKAMKKAKREDAHRRASSLCERFEAAGLRSAMFSGSDGTITLSLRDAEALLKTWLAAGGWPRALLAKPEGK